MRAEVCWVRVGDGVEYLCPRCKTLGSLSETHPPYIRVGVKCVCGLFFIVKGEEQRNSCGRDL